MDNGFSISAALRLAPDQLRRPCDPSRFRFASTADLVPLDGALAQGRAVDAIRLGLKMRRGNFNVFALGPPGIGKHAVIQHFTATQAAGEATPPDWVYVNNFAEPHRPNAMRLPAGRGAALRQAMLALTDDLRAAIPAAFESDDYRTRRQVIDEEFKRKQEEAFSRTEEDARLHGVTIFRTPLGMGLAPTKGDEVIPPEAFRKLPAEEQNRMTAEMDRIREAIAATFRQLPQWESERHRKVRELNQSVVRFAIAHLMGRLREQFSDVPNILNYLQIVEQDLVENAGQLLVRAQSEGGELPIDPVAMARPDGDLLHRYQVNLVIDHSGKAGAPIIGEDHPTIPNLIGRVEFRPRFGALVTDFTMIRAGALHAANGGYLVLDARRVLLQPFAWEALKRALRAREIRIQSVAEMAGLISAETLQPEPIPLDVKVVLMGERSLYYLLCALDPDFQELFKIAADFDDAIDRDATKEVEFARLLASLAKANGLRPLDPQAVARMVEQAARMAGDAAKLSAELETIADILREADFRVEADGRSIIGAADIESAIDARIHRASRMRERLQEGVARGTLLIATGGERIGQLNGLSVFGLGGFTFGHPTRITARVRLGKGEVIDIEREVELGGPIHSKGVLILAGYLSGRFARRRPLALSASIVFEQSYGAVEGDSASLAELCALLSALAGAGLKQGTAVTGSVNQHGAVQPIGGVNEKVEGFFDICKKLDLSGDQGVIIPAANVEHLMLRHDVVEAVAAQRFHIYAVSSVDQAISILSGTPAGERDSSGSFPAGTINHRVEAELAAMSEAARRFIARPDIERQS